TNNPQRRSTLMRPRVIGTNMQPNYPGSHGAHFGRGRGTESVKDGKPFSVTLCDGKRHFRKAEVLMVANRRKPKTAAVQDVHIVRNVYVVAGLSRISRLRQ